MSQLTDFERVFVVLCILRSWALDKARNNLAQITGTDEKTTDFDVTMLDAEIEHIMYMVGINSFLVFNVADLTGMVKAKLPECNEARYCENLASAGSIFFNSSVNATTKDEDRTHAKEKLQHAVDCGFIRPLFVEALMWPNNIPIEPGNSVAPLRTEMDALFKECTEMWEEMAEEIEL